MSSLNITLPSKTFIFGEYAVLADPTAPALLANTAPCFKILINQNKPFQITGIKKNTPIYAHFENLPVSINFDDPHQEQGGFGASGAQWITAYLAENYFSVQDQSIHLSAQAAKDYFKTHNQTLESGYDILAQFTGKLTLINDEKKNTDPAKSYDWPFPNLGFAIIRTNLKIKTHEHLDDINLEILTPLVDIAKHTANAFKQSDSKIFLKGIQTYADCLKDLGLSHQHTQKLLTEIMAHDFFLAAKGCGALGADTIIVFYAKDNVTKALDFLEKNYHLIATEKNLVSSTW